MDALRLRVELARAVETALVRVGVSPHAPYSVSDALFTAAGRAGSSPAATGAVRARLLDDLDIPGALDLATEDGGDAARQLVRVLSLG
jgi:hypothetical protein